MPQCNRGERGRRRRQWETEGGVLCVCVCETEREREREMTEVSSYDISPYINNQKSSTRVWPHPACSPSKPWPEKASAGCLSCTRVLQCFTEKKRKKKQLWKSHGACRLGRVQRRHLGAGNSSSLSHQWEGKGLTIQCRRMTITFTLYDIHIVVLDKSVYESGHSVWRESHYSDAYVEEHYWMIS